MIYSCKHCQRKLEFKNKHTITGHLRKCAKYKEWKNAIFTKEFLVNEYQHKGKSALEIAVEHGMASSSAIDRLIKEFEIPRRNISEASKMPRCQEQKAITNIEIYGTYNVFCKNSTSRKEWEQRLFDTEGITNVFQRPDVILKCRNAQKYGSNYTKPHKAVVNELNLANIANEIEFPLRYNNIPGMAGFKFYDIIINGTNKLIEVNGEYYHADPRRYRSDDVITHHGCESFVKDIWKKDAEKLQIAHDGGYEVLVLWERDINDGSYKDTLWNYLK